MAIVAVGACATSAEEQPTTPIAGNPPEVVDYLMAVQCNGVLAALQDLGQNTPMALEYGRDVKSYHEGAVFRAAQAARTGAASDTRVSKMAMLEESGEGSDETRRQRLFGEFGGEIRACRSLSDLPDIVFVGG